VSFEPSKSRADRIQWANGRWDTLALTLATPFAICRLDKNARVPGWALTGDFFSVTRTADELSLVCAQANVPTGIGCSSGWRCFKVESPFEFDLNGAITSIALPLVEADIGTFVVATQDSDYLMVKDTDLDRAVRTLSQGGHWVELEST